MTRYQWPAVRGGSRDDPAGRAGFVRAYRAPPPEIQERALAHRRTALAAARRALEPGAARLAPSVDNDNMWVPVGPTSVVKGQARFRPRISGRVRDVAVSPNGERVYVATANGGVWYSSDAGTSWLPVGAWTSAVRAEVTTAATPLTCGCLLVNFDTDPAGENDFVLVGTGEIAPFSGGIPGGRLGGVGVLFSQGPVPQARADPLSSPWQREGKNLKGYGIFRLAFEPDNPDRVVAATSHGLWTRSGAPTLDSEWERITTPPFDEASLDPGYSNFQCTDVAWSEERTSIPPISARLYVCVNDTREAFLDDDSGVWVSESGVDGPFRFVNLPGSEKNSRFGIAKAPSDERVLYVLGKGPHLWRMRASSDDIGDIAADEVEKVPVRLFGLGAKDQSYYDLALAVDPERSDQVVLGGSTAFVDDHNAALFRCKVSPEGGVWKLDYTIDKKEDERNELKQATDRTFIGEGIHADVHQIVWRKVGTRRDMWVACDGGVFLSRANGDRGTFVSRNTGIASLEAGFVAGHPTNDVAMIIGTQDNGVLKRIGDTLWVVALEGDGGGVAYHPTDPRQFVGQYTRARWYDQDDNEVKMVHRAPGGVLIDSEITENEGSAFYSGVAMATNALGTVRLAIGTVRVWLSEDFGHKWATLPSGEDPRKATSAVDNRQNWKDDVPFLPFIAWFADPPPDARVVALRWVDYNRLLVLCTGAVFLFDFDGAQWRRTLITRYKQPSCSTIDPDEVTSPAKDLMPIGRWSDIARHAEARGTKGCGSFYVTTTGPPKGESPQDAPNCDTLWWFDGTDKWYATGLRAATDGVPAPAYAVAVHPWNNEFVFVGTSVGVWRGRFDDGPNGPTWDWSHDGNGAFVNGLPEAAVQDLSFFELRGPPSQLLLRAALQARGVWEVDLAGPQDPQTYLRVHSYDSRRMSPSVLPPVAAGLGTLQWNLSPDVRARIGPGSPTHPAPVGLPWTSTTPLTAGMRWELWIFQVALRHYLETELHADSLVRADGSWTAAFDERIVAARKIAPPLTGSGIAMIDPDLWARVVTPPHVYADPWGGAPTEADLFELIVDRAALLTDEAGSNIGPGPAKFDVLVHHRHGRAAPANEVFVTVVSAALPDSPADWATMPVPWTADVVDLLNNGGVPPSGWTQPAAPWMVGSGTVPTRTSSGPLVLQPTGPVDPRTPQAVTFDLDFTGAPPFSTWVVVAVVHSVADPVALFSTTLQELVLNNRHVAVRTVET
ncbi:MAG TPA: hypothetical protein VH912_24535 [Streptosporangiaceae bacterium]